MARTPIDWSHPPENGHECRQPNLSSAGRSNGTKMTAATSRGCLGLHFGCSLTPSNTAVVPMGLICSAPAFEQMQNRGGLRWAAWCTENGVGSVSRGSCRPCPLCGPNPPLHPPSLCPVPPAACLHPCPNHPCYGMALLVVLGASACWLQQWSRAGAPAPLGAKNVLYSTRRWCWATPMVVPEGLGSRRIGLLHAGITSKLGSCNCMESGCWFCWLSSECLRCGWQKLTRIAERDLRIGARDLSVRKAHAVPLNYCLFLWAAMIIFFLGLKALLFKKNTHLFHLGGTEPKVSL